MRKVIEMVRNLCYFEQVWGILRVRKIGSWTMLVCAKNVLKCHLVIRPTVTPRYL